MNNTVTPPPTAEDIAYQDRILQDVSRTFALTIPQLPADLCRVVGNAYLLCRIADTIEDDNTLGAAQQHHFAEYFTDVVRGAAPAKAFAEELHPLLSQQLLPAERDLVLHTPTVIRISHSFSARQRAALERCVRIMARGMAEYQERESLAGLTDLKDMGSYCYYVAGVVGEMLTELFCAYSPEIDARREELMQLAVSFGQGLQMTNILKDIWEDRQRGACWLPRDVFAHHGVNLEQLQPGADGPGFADALGQLIGVARAHLANALRYTLLIPPREKGMRRFCLWALGMAVLTLRKINHRRNFTSGQEVKITRRSVKATVLVTSALVSRDMLLRAVFNLAARDLPTADVDEKLNKLSYS